MEYILSVPEIVQSLPSGWTQWAGAIRGAILVGLTGVLPLWVVPAKVGGSSSGPGNDDNLKYLPAFAVGGLLGDVFLHLLPEIYQHMIDYGDEGGAGKIGVAVLTGILTFLILEKVLEISNPETIEEWREKENKKIVGYLNLFANCTDNLLHGLAVGTSFLSSFRLGVTTTAAILLHEIPHEFGDFAILLKSGFNRWEAAKAKISTALVGLLGALLALAFESNNNFETLLIYILPFTAGGFLNIALVSVVPELMEVRLWVTMNFMIAIIFVYEKRPGPALGQFICLIGGIVAMSLLTMV